MRKMRERRAQLLVGAQRTQIGVVGDDPRVHEQMVSWVRKSGHLTGVHVAISRSRMSSHFHSEKK